MKTAVSLSNALFEKAQAAALYMGIPRSKLFSMALEEFISRHDGNLITEKLNEVYGKIHPAEFSDVLVSNLDSLRQFTKNDTW